MEVFNPLSIGHTKIFQRTCRIFSLCGVVSSGSSQRNCVATWVTYRALASLPLVLADAPTPTLLAPGSLPPVLADAPTPAILAPASLPLVLADALTPTLLAYASLPPVLAN